MASSIHASPTSSRRLTRPLLERSPRRVDEFCASGYSLPYNYDIAVPAIQQTTTNDSQHMSTTNSQSPMNVCALITTCQRPEGLRRTLEAWGKIPAIVLQDGGEPYAPKAWNRLPLVVDGPGGKSGYWQRINTLWQRASDTGFDHFIHLPDDFAFDPDWFDRVLRAYDGIHPLNIAVLGRPHCWGFTGYVDGAFIAPRSAFEALNWTIEPIPASRWERNPKLGSGVWAQVTKRWHKLGIIPRLIDRDPVHGTFDPELSVMNPDRE
jgi:hypothetical protein